jgi:hypothetical protein
MSPGNSVAVSWMDFGIATLQCTVQVRCSCRAPTADGPVASYRQLNSLKRGFMRRLLCCCAACAAALISLVLWIRPPSPAVGQASALAADSTREGVFEGRTPCAPIATRFTGFPAGGCEKIKWEVTLYRDAITAEPRSYRYRGTRTSHNGIWSASRGSASNPSATVYELQYDNGVLLLLAADENVLLLLDSDRTLLVGDASWSYTLNRTDRQ